MLDLGFFFCFLFFFSGISKKKQRKVLLATFEYVFKNKGTGGRGLPSLSGKKL